MKYIKNHFAGILSVILAVVSLSGSSMPVVSANSAERIAKKETIVKLDEKLGAEPGKVLEELKNHEKDGYYLGTPYSGYPLTAENCMRPNGAYGGNGISDSLLSVLSAAFTSFKSPRMIFSFISTGFHIFRAL